MEPFFLFLPVVVGLAALGIYLAWARQQQRIAALRGLAASLGWQYSRHDAYGLTDRWSGPPFGRGYARRAENVLTGEHRGRPVVVFDYSYKEDSRDGDGNGQTTTYEHTVAALRMPASLPGLAVRPESFLSRIGNALGFDDIELESEDFNRAYKVRCPDRKFASDVLHPRTMELLLHGDRIQFRFEGADVLCWEDGWASPGDVLRWLGAVTAVLDGIPEFVWKDYGGLAGRPSA